MKSGVVLAGGKSSRFGTNKALVQFQGKPLVKWTIDTISTIVDETLLSLSPEPETSRFIDALGKEISIVMDAHPGLGPISGLLSSFKEAKGEYVAVAPCDTPFIMPKLYQRLFEVVKGSDGAVPMINGQWEPLHGVYKREAMIIALEKVIAGGKTRPINTYKYLNIKELTQDEIKDFDPELVSFVNINSLKDLEAASSIPRRPRHAGY